MGSANTRVRLSILLAYIIVASGSDFMLSARSCTGGLFALHCPGTHEYSTVIQPSRKLKVLDPPHGALTALPPFSLPPVESVSPSGPPKTSITPPTYLLPPSAYIPSPGPPDNGHQGPPKHTPSLNPPDSGQGRPSPPRQATSPPIYRPPMSHPPPSAPPTLLPPPPGKPTYAVWCVAKPTVPDAVIQEAMDYACGSGADCKPIQPNGPCYQPDTLLAHASFAFNSYWQNKKQAGGTCDFGGVAMLVTADPSYNGCRFIFH